MRATLLALAAPARAQETGGFDCYVLALSWPPNRCALEGGAEGAEQCEPGAGFGSILHGLRPQHEESWPDWCEAEVPDPSRRETAAMADITGSGGLAWHAWRKHGTCSGLTAGDYFALAREAFEAVAIQAGFAALDRLAEVPTRAVEAAFLRANPGLEAEGITVAGRQGHVQEVRICLDRDLWPRACGADVARDCTLRDAVPEPIP